MKPNEIKAVLAEMGGKANKALGQHFLVDEHALQSIVASADIHANDRVLEIGPGLGVLSLALREAGAEVFAIEQDRRFLER
jgi:16S rRNA (adenine1518-N6/adenine1519-N6)-dimethyltransferase